MTKLPRILDLARPPSARTPMQFLRRVARPGGGAARYSGYMITAQIESGAYRLFKHWLDLRSGACRLLKLLLKNSSHPLSLVPRRTVSSRSLPLSAHPKPPRRPSSGSSIRAAAPFYPSSEHTSPIRELALRVDVLPDSTTTSRATTQSAVPRVPPRVTRPQLVAHTITNGKPGGKLPGGNLAVRSPPRSFSAAPESLPHRLP